MSIIGWILLGLIAGWLASLVMKGGYGLLGDIMLGIVGALVGGFLSSLLLGIDVTGFNLTSILVVSLKSATRISRCWSVKNIKWKWRNRSAHIPSFSRRSWARRKSR